MLQNAYFLAKIGADTAENEQQFAEILPKTGNYLSGDDEKATAESAALIAEELPVVSELADFLVLGYLGCLCEPFLTRLFFPPISSIP